MKKREQEMRFSIIKLGPINSLRPFNWHIGFRDVKHQYAHAMPVFSFGMLL
jgi:hypothetical protein